MKVRSTLRDFMIAAAAVAVTSVLLVSYIAPKAEADHEPANKVAAAGSTVEVLEPNDKAVPVLSERVKVSSAFDLILSLSSECSILSALRTGDGDEEPPVPPATSASDSTDTKKAFSQLSMYITIDGKRVPVTATESTPRGPGESNDTTSADEPAKGQGEVVFCNREYQRTVTDSEDNDPKDGIDTQEDYIRTRTANAFNWLALDVGFNYDEACVVAGGTDCVAMAAPNGNNVVDIVVWAEFDRRGTAPCGNAMAGQPVIGESDACADAFVGRRTLIAEPTNASVHEWVNSPTDPAAP